MYAFRFCPDCGARLPEPEPAEHVLSQTCETCKAIHWRNAKPCAGALVVSDGRVLLGRRAVDPAKGAWDIPGGFLEEGEEALDGLRRELREETGLEVEPVEWLGAYVDPYDDHYVLGLSWLVRGEGEPRADDDVAELAWFGPDELPVEMAFATQLEVLALWAARHRKG